jgi:hypothetical protein
MSSVDVTLRPRPSVSVGAGNICYPATYTLVNTATPPATLDSGSIAAGGSETIVAPPVTVLRDGQPFSVVPSDETVDVPSDAPPATITINSAPFASVPSSGSLNVPVKNSAGTLRGSKVGSDWVVPDGSVPVTNTAATPITTIAVPSGNSVPYVIPNVAWTDSDGSAESTPYGTPIVCTLAPTIPTLAVSVSDATPDFGQSITITATPTGFTPNNYLFFAKQGSTLREIGSQVGGVLNWTVNISGTFSIFVQADNGTAGAFNVGGSSVTSTSVVIMTNVQVYLDPHFSGIVGTNYPDLSAFARNGTLVNSPTVDTNLNFGNVLFNGVNQYISVGSVSTFSFIQNTMQFTIEAWVKVNNASSRNFFIANTATASQQGFAFSLDTEGSFPATRQLRCTLFNGSGDGLTNRTIRTNDNAITDTNWHHIAVTLNGLNTGVWYIDGVAQTTIESGAYTAPTGNSTNVLEIGKIGGFAAYYAGRVGPLRIYNYALTPAQITNNFNAERSRYGL